MRPVPRRRASSGRDDVGAWPGRPGDRRAMRVPRPGATRSRSTSDRSHAVAEVRNPAPRDHGRVEAGAVVLDREAARDRRPRRAGSSTPRRGRRAWRRSGGLEAAEVDRRLDRLRLPRQPYPDRHRVAERAATALSAGLTPACARTSGCRPWATSRSSSIASSTSRPSRSRIARSSARSSVLARERPRWIRRANRRCCALSCSSRSIRRRSASPACRIRARDARSSPSRRAVLDREQRRRRRGAARAPGPRSGTRRPPSPRRLPVAIDRHPRAARPSDRQREPVPSASRKRPAAGSR